MGSLICTATVLCGGRRDSTLSEDAEFLPDSDSVHGPCKWHHSRLRLEFSNTSFIGQEDLC